MMCWKTGKFFSKMVDYSLYKYYKGEVVNPFEIDSLIPLVYHFWEYEREFHLNYIQSSSKVQPIEKAYKQFRDQLLYEHLNFVSPDGKIFPYNKEYMDKVFETGKR